MNATLHRTPALKSMLKELTPRHIGKMFVTALQKMWLTDGRFAMRIEEDDVDKIIDLQDKFIAGKWMPQWCKTKELATAVQRSEAIDTKPYETEDILPRKYEPPGFILKFKEYVPETECSARVVLENVNLQKQMKVPANSFYFIQKRYPDATLHTFSNKDDAFTRPVVFRYNDNVVAVVMPLYVEV